MLTALNYKKGGQATFCAKKQHVPFFSFGEKKVAKRE